MCLAIPARVLELRQDGSARADLGGLEIEIRIDLVPDVSVGDYVIVHAGYAITVMDEQEAQESLSMLEQMYGSQQVPKR